VAVGLGTASADEGELPDRFRRLFDAARGPGTPEELSKVNEIVHAMRAALAETVGVDELATRRARRGTKLVARVAVVMAGVLVGASTAAATGVLPDVAQSAVARATAHVGLNLPNPDHERANTTSTESSETNSTDRAATDRTEASGSAPADGTTPISPPPPERPHNTPNTPNPSVTTIISPPTVNGSATTVAATTADTSQPSGAATTPLGPNVTSSAKTGLCQEWAARQRNGTLNLDSVDMRRLAAAAQQVGNTIAHYCSTVLPSLSSTPVTASSAPIVTESSSPIATASTAPPPLSTVPTSAETTTTPARDDARADEHAHVGRMPVRPVKNSTGTELGSPVSPTAPQ
jgi:hypothetical protein